MTMRDLAAKFGFPLSVISRIELGQVNTTINTAGILARTLEVELTEIFSQG